MAPTTHEMPGPLAESDAPPPITSPYTLFVVCTNEVDAQGRRFTDAAWAKDLALHLDYLTDLTVVSPSRRTTTATLHWICLDEPPFDRVKFVDLPCPVGVWQALRTLPRQVVQYWRAIGPARIVHCGFAGWPIVQGWLAVPLAKLRHKFVLANVESSDWRAPAGSSWPKRLQGALGELLTRATLRMSDIRLFTAHAYVRDLMPPGAPRTYVTTATWLDEDWILAEPAALDAWSAKQGPVRLLFASRVVEHKGVLVLLAAIRLAAAAGTDVAITIHPIRSSGPLVDACHELARELPDRLTVTAVDEVPFGEPFLRFLRGFDAVLVPSMSDEQPRITLEAFSQAVPVIGSATGGLGEVVEAGVNGRLTTPGDVDALAGSIVWAGQNRPQLREMGLRGLASVRGLTHLGMHQKRHRILREVFRARE